MTVESVNTQCRTTMVVSLRMRLIALMSYFLNMM